MSSISCLSSSFFDCIFTSSAKAFPSPGLFLGFCVMLLIVFWRVRSLVAVLFSLSASPVAPALTDASLLPLLLATKPLATDKSEGRTPPCVAPASAAPAFSPTSDVAAAVAGAAAAGASADAPTGAGATAAVAGAAAATVAAAAVAVADAAASGAAIGAGDAVGAGDADGVGDAVGAVGTTSLAETGVAPLDGTRSMSAGASLGDPGSTLFDPDSAASAECCFRTECPGPDAAAERGVRGDAGALGLSSSWNRARRCEEATDLGESSPSVATVRLGRPAGDRPLARPEPPASSPATIDTEIWTPPAFCVWDWRSSTRSRCSSCTFCNKRFCVASSSCRLAISWRMFFSCSSCSRILLCIPSSVVGADLSCLVMSWYFF
mmetsp:Transcript_13868/g.29026  ORF Transcript_13868/g.29026 Transcript_13868/m.29026 type:complete len:378 (-) Transcript_13868:214-1347(-)